MSEAAAIIDRELASLVRRCGEELGIARESQGRWILRPVHDGAFDVVVCVDGERMSVEVGPWAHDLELEGDDDDAAIEAAHLALDLVAAALFGDIELREVRAGGSLASWSVALSTEQGEVELARGKVGRWRPWVRKIETRRRNHVARPPDYRAEDVVAPPWAAWSGRGGFTRAESASPAELAFDGELDLHNFSPKEVKPLVLATIEQAVERGHLDLRIVHGKGKGVLRRTVHSILERHEAVESFRLGSHGEGSWGATMVRLKSGQ